METLTLTGARRDAVAFAPRAHLVVALACGDPCTGGSRHALDDVDEVLLGRGPSNAARRATDGGARRLAIDLADGHVSSLHARLVRDGDRWAVDDAGSKNGTFVNERIARRAILADGDRLRVGRTILLFRAALPTAPTTPRDAAPTGEGPLVTLVPRLAHDLDALAAVATTDLPILLASETGTGKELLARAVHALSRRRGELVALHCGAIPPNLVESTLFGHKRGAFSGATADAPGLFRAADGGTLLLDELGDMPAAAQCAVLRALQEGEVVPVGATHPQRVDVRVVAATHRDLERGVASGAFREDLLARLAGFVFRLPPLRERLEDFGLLAAAILRRLEPRPASIDPAAGAALLRYAWPRNVRELAKCLAGAAALARGGAIELRHLPPAVRGEPPAIDRDARPSPSERDRLVALLMAHGGNVQAVASAMATSRAQVHRVARRFAIDLDAYRRS